MPNSENILRDNIVSVQRSLTSLIGVSGREEAVRNFIYAEMKKFVNKVWIDPLGNVLAEKPGSNPEGKRVMLDAHMDEVGFMIRYIDERGFLRFSPLGGIDPRLYPGSKVEILNEKGDKITGIIGMPPPHITSPAEREKSPNFMDLFIDIGAPSFEKVREMGIDVGSTGVLAADFEYLPELGIMRGRAFDDRTGCNVLLQIAKLLSENDETEDTVCFAFTIAEEVGARGAKVAANSLNPDIGIAVENTIAADVPGVSPDKCPTKSLQGPAFSAADHGTIYHAKLLKYLQNTAKELQIPYQYKLPTFGGTNAGSFHTLQKGIPAACVSVPCRYIHSAIGQNYVEDIEMVVKVLYKAISRPIDISH